MELLFSAMLFTTLSLFAAFFFWGYRLGVRGCWQLTLGGIAMQLTVLLYFFTQYTVTFGSFFYHFDYGIWFSLGHAKVDFSFILDTLALLMMQLVLLVSSVTQVYSYYYLANEPNLLRFQSYLQLFTFFMLLLVTADNLVLFFVGWEGVGLCSYLLISFWSSRPEARLAGLKAVAVNRIGDCAFIGAAGILFAFTHSFDYAVLFNLLPQLAQLEISLLGWSLPLLELVGLLFLLAAAAKSAQLGLHTWLADAMEGPTPVSALIHAATMVTAGIYLIIRLAPLFEYTPLTSEVMAYLGGYTALFGALTAAMQWDIKKIIAYSTCSQLGYMLCVCGFGGYKLAFYHLINHGYFKALLFLAAGVLIHNLKGEQDIRRMGSLFFAFPLTLSYFVVGSASLVGLPGTAGFASKEKILDLLSVLPGDSAVACYNLLLGALFFTVFYTAKLFYFVFLRQGYYARSQAEALRKPSVELPGYVAPALGILVFLSLWADSVLHHCFFGLGGLFLDSTSAQGAVSFTQLLGEFYSEPQRCFPLLIILASVIFFIAAYLVLSMRFCVHSLSGEGRRQSFLVFFLQRGWCIDYTQNFLVALLFPGAIRRALTLEKGFGELLGPSGLQAFATWLGAALGALHGPRRMFANVTLMFILLLPLLVLSADNVLYA